MEKNNLKGECKYCGAEINKSCIRCYKCNLVWQDGAEHGRVAVALELQEIFMALKNLARLEEE